MVQKFMFKSLELKSSWLESPGLKDLGLKLGVEKSGVEMSFNHYFFCSGSIFCFQNLLYVQHDDWLLLLFSCENEGIQFSYSFLTHSKGIVKLTAS